MSAIHDRITITLFACSPSDDAWNYDIDDIDARMLATISKATYEAIIAARAALDANPAWECIAVASDMECPKLDNVLDASTLWRTRSEEFLIYRLPGLYLRIQEKNNRQAEIEYEVSFPDGLSIPHPTDGTVKAA